MGTLKFRRKTGNDTPGTLVHGQLGFTQNRLYFGNQAGTAIRLATFDETGGGALNDLSDVTITGPSSGHMLVHNGSVFANTATLPTHNHGYLSNTGTWTGSPATIASSDYLVIADHSDSNKLIFSTTQFGSGTTTWLANNGTWSTPTAAQVSAVPLAGGTLTGLLIGRTNTAEQINVATQGTPSFEAYSTNNAAAFMTFHKSGHYAVRFGLDTDHKLKVGGWSMGANAYEIWHAGNNNIGTGADNYAAGNHDHDPDYVRTDTTAQSVGGIKTFTGQVAHTPTTLGTTGTITINFALASLRTQAALTGNVTYATSNRVSGRSVTIRVLNGATQRTLTFPAGWRWVSAKPTNIAASKLGILTVSCMGGTADSDIVAAWAVEA